ncbi:hypothetical protein [uncultured Hyphomonas sp.]|uniref:hypothetical protein n=1 Tax=uncultured Hyphomonas sp. TaxID=225298 RepID=UPI002AAAD38C|nr:hypothetical protein [uncultured Hyphomonas sp.]
MSFPVPARTHSLISHWWSAVQSAVDDMLARFAPADDAQGQAAPLRLSHAEAWAVRTAIGIFEALVRRMLVVMCAEYGPMAPLPEGVKLLFRIDECPPVPVIRRAPAADPDHFLKAPSAGLPRSEGSADGLVSAAPLLKRLAALADVFENGDLYLLAMRARLHAPLKPLLAPQPKAFTDPALSVEQADNMQYLHAVALDVQSHDSS